MRNSSADWRKERETRSTLVAGTKRASAKPRRATTVDLPAWRQQFRSRRGWPPSNTWACQGSGSRPRFRMRRTAGGRGQGGGCGGGGGGGGGGRGSWGFKCLAKTQRRKEE